jgi:hypothetical protein
LDKLYLMDRLTRDQPGQALELEWKGFHPTILFRGCFTFFGLLVVVMGVLLAVTLRWGEPNVCFVLAVLPGPFFLLIPWASGLYMGYEHRIAWDQALTIWCRGPYLLLGWKRVVPIPGIRSLKIHVEEPGIARLWLAYEKGRRVRRLLPAA